MEQKISRLFRRILSMLLCVAMLASYVVLPVGATGSTEGEQEAAPDPTLKFELPVQNANYYQDNQTVLTYSSWLQTLACDGIGYGTLKTFLQNEADQFIDLSPKQETIKTNKVGDGAVKKVPTRSRLCLLVQPAKYL